MQPSLSIVVPTHNRPQYVVATIRALFEHIPSAEIVVSDTSPEDAITPSLDTALLNSPRFKLLRSERPLSVVENFERGYHAATGRYMIFIGDDDFVHPAIERVVQWAEANSIEALTSSLPAHYYWPDFAHKRRGDHYAGALFCKPFTGKVELFDAKRKLLAAADDLGSGPLEMPRAYTGMVAKALLERVVDKYGAIFGGVSPDVYSSALISQESRRSARFDFPFIIPGSSGKSTAGQSASGGHVGKLRQNDHISAFKNLQWNPFVPEFYSIQSVWSYSLIQALQKIDFPVRDINYARLYVKCLINHPGYFGLICSTIGAYAAKAGYLKTLCRMLLACGPESSWLFGRVMGVIAVKLGRETPQGTEIRSLADTAQATVASANSFALQADFLK